MCQGWILTHLLSLLEVSNNAGAKEILEFVLAAGEILSGHSRLLLEFQDQGVGAAGELLPHTYQDWGEAPRHTLHLQEGHK